MMHRDQDGTKLISRRALLLGGGQAALLATLIGRMYFLQVVESDKYATLADQNRINLRLLPPPRGRILDRNGIPLAVNQQNYRVLVVAEQADDIGDTLDLLANIVPIGDRERARIVRETEKRRSFVPVMVRENLTWEEMSRVEINTPDLPGVMIDVGQSRDYPLKELGAHILGYVSAVSEADLQGSSDPLLELPGFRIGKAGVEKVYDMALRGKGGTSQVEVNAVGRVIRELSRDEGQAGADLKLAIDLELQKYAMGRMSEESASLALIDVHTGEVLVLASTPSFDPNAFNRGLTGDEWKDLTGNVRAPLTNKAIAGQYAPGSTFKLMTALAGLESNSITADTKVFCPGQWTIGNATLHCWKPQGHGTMDLLEAIKHSCDVYFYEVARRTQFERIAEMAKRFGLGEPTGLDLPGERGGTIPNKAWKAANLGQPWYPGETPINGIGQGYVTATPLQLAVMTARIANGGYGVTPHLAQDELIDGKLKPRKASDWPDLGISSNSLNLVRRGMQMVVNEQGGTAFAERITDPTMAMAGKTGSAQVRRVTAHEHEIHMKVESLPWKERDNALFVAYAPVSAPKYAIGICVEHGMHGASAAGPIARDVMIKAQRRALDQAASGGAAGPAAAPPASGPDHGHDNTPTYSPDEENEAGGA
jgi:penicillin-binding protein 2